MFERSRKGEHALLIQPHSPGGADEDALEEFSELAQFILEHHERWDGKGYPKGLKSEDVSIEGRIIAIADSYDAMTSYRTYRKALSEEEAVAEIKRCAGTQFDPDLAKIFVEKVLGKKW